MSSTLPRTRSVSAASSTSSAASTSKERVRPVSLCETSWARMTGQDLRQQNLVRTPSQATNLCTTVPQSLVMQNLGGRHTPTRSSLRHSRMLVLAKNNGKGSSGRRWASHSLGRVGVLVVTGQMVVGVMGATLAAWFMLWAPSLSFFLVPHYAAIPVLVAGVCGAVLISCFQQRRRRQSAKVVKVVLAVLCVLAMAGCVTLCVFTALHMARLAPMTCMTKHDSITHKAPPSSLPPPLSPEPEVTRSPSSPLLAYGDDEDEVEGSGLVMRDLHGPLADYDDDRLDDDYSNMEVETATLREVRVRLDHDIVLNVSWCECESRHGEWVRTLTYPDLSCPEVNNLLPVLLVASVVVSAVAAVLCGMVLYLLWAFRNSVYGPAKPYETRPFIFTSNLSKGAARGVTNGDQSYR